MEGGEGVLRPSGDHTPTAGRSLAKLVSQENPLPGRSTYNALYNPPQRRYVGSTAVDATAAPSRIAACRDIRV